MGIVYEILHVASAGAIASDLNEFTTGSSCCGTTARETGVCFLSVSERKMQKLVLKVRRGFRHDGYEDHLV